jgi:broad specificity phosphatase PhoE
MASPILYFLRHGETDWNAERRLQGQHDIPLNVLGRSQAVCCGGILAAELARIGRAADSFDFVASPLSRARVTMELARGALGLDPSAYRTDPRLMELSFGEWEGFTYDELKTHDPENLLIAARDQKKWTFLPPGGESYLQLLARVAEWHGEIERDTVVVAHGGVCRVLIAHFGIEGPSDAPVHNIEQGVIYEFAPGMFKRLA